VLDVWYNFELHISYLSKLLQVVLFSYLMITHLMIIHYLGFLVMFVHIIELYRNVTMLLNTQNTTFTATITTYSIIISYHQGSLLRICLYLKTWLQAYIWTRQLGPKYQREPLHLWSFVSAWLAWCCNILLFHRNLRDIARYEEKKNSAKETPCEIFLNECQVYFS
jgi:hypothetical protein